MTTNESLGANSRPYEDPYHSDLHQLIIKEMTTNGGDVPLSYHEQQCLGQELADQLHKRAVQFDATTYPEAALRLQETVARNAVKSLEVQLCAAQRELSIARDALALKISCTAATATQ